MKTQGFDIEAVPLAEAAPLKNLACATLIAAIQMQQIQQILHDRDSLAACRTTDVLGAADLPLVEAIGKTLEGKTIAYSLPTSGSAATLANILCHTPDLAQRVKRVCVFFHPPKLSGRKRSGMLALGGVEHCPDEQAVVGGGRTARVETTGQSVLNPLALIAAQSVTPQPPAH